MAKLLIISFLLIHCASSDYWMDRDTFIRKEELKILGSPILLTPKEERVNRILMAHKIQEYEDGFNNVSQFNPARHFFHAREDIEKSQVFAIIKKMPKGAALHLHDLFAISQEYLLNLTYRDNVYGCQADDELYLKFLNHATQDSFCNWTILRTPTEQNTYFDTYLKKQFFLNVENPRATYPDITVIWKKMNKLFRKYALFLGYKPVFQEQFYQSLLELYQDNVRYYEVRTGLADVYDLDGRLYTPVEIAGFYEETVRRFKANFPDFIGVRLIYIRPRHIPYAGPDDKDVQLLNELYQTYPNFFVGFDICGQEDLGKPLQHFVDFVNQIPPALKRFFHAGETNWYGESDLNVIDAVLLNSTRIGHGFGLAKHPLVLKTIRKRRTAIEVCPISNQVLMLVEDLRNHPAVSLIAWGYPVVIGNDNPNLWGAVGLSYDFYMAFMGMTGKTVDLKVLKQLALNSLEYSALPALEKLEAIELWRRDWEVFLDLVIFEAGLKRLSDEL